MTDFWPQLEQWLLDRAAGKLVAALVILLVTWVVVRLIRRPLLARIADSGTRYRARKGINAIGWVTAMVAVAAVFSDRLGQFTVVFGVAGAGIAFALQEVIASIAGWVAVSLGGFYQVGNRVQLGGIKGDVIDVGLLRTTLAEVGEWVKGDLYNGRIVRVANSFVLKEPVHNYSGDFPFLWDELSVPIRHGSDVATTQTLLEGIADEVCGAYAQEASAIWAKLSKRYPLEPASTSPMVTLVFDENWMTFTVRYVVRFDRRRRTKHLLSTQILTEVARQAPKVSLAATAMELFPMTPLHVVSDAPEGA